METEKPSEDNKHEVEAICHAIKTVERAKAKTPELYSKALAELKDDAKVISSVKELKSIAKKKRGEDDDV